MGLAETRELDLVLKLKDQASQELASVSGQLSSMGKYMGLALTGGIVAMGALGKSAIQAAGDLETQRVGFKTLLGSIEQADAAIEMIKKDAAETPFEFTGLVEANKALTFVTGNAQTSEKVLLNVGKALAAAGKGQEALDGVIYNLQQIGNTGKITEMDIRQFGNNGVNILQLLADYYGTTKEKAVDMVKNSKDAFGDLSAAFEKAGSDGGRYATAFADANGTYNQSVSNLVDSWTIAMADIAAKSGLFDMVKKAISAVTGFISEHKDDIVNFIKNSIDKIEEFGAKVWTFIQPAYNALKQFFDDVENRKAAIVAVLTILTIAFAAWGISVIASMAPLLIAIAAIGAAIFVLKKAWDEDWGGIQEKTRSVFEAISNFYNQYLVPFFNVLKAKQDEVNKWWSENWTWISQIFKGVWEVIKGIAEVGWALVSGIIKVGIDIFTGNWKKAWEDVKKMFEGVWNGIKDFFIGIWDVIKGAAIGGINALIDRVNGMIDELNKIKMPDWAPGIGGKGINIGKISHVGDAIITPQGNIVHTDPKDFLIATKTPGALVGAGVGGLTINIQGGYYLDRNAGEKIAEALSETLRRKLRL